MNELGSLAGGLSFAIVYGSLIPFAFEPRSFDDATAFLRQSPPPPSAALGNPDFGLNVALYVPLGFLIAATIGTRCRLLTPLAPSYLSRALVVTSAVAASLAVSLAMEIAQGYTTARSADLGDVLANGLGGLIGAALVGLSTQTVLHGLGLLGAGGRGATKPVAALGIIDFVLFSFFPFDFVKDTAHLYAKLESGLIAPFLAPAYCRDVAPCAARIALESVFAALLALLLAVWLPLKTRLAHWAAAGAAVGLGVEFVQVFLASGIAQGASIATRALGFLSVGWCVAALKRSGLDFIRLHASLVAPGLFACAALAIVAVNRIHPPFAWPPEPALTVLNSVNWVPFGYLFEVTEARIAQSVMAQLPRSRCWARHSGSTRSAADALLSAVVLSRPC
ncbi:MAG: VanZ family protein [Betaproteobacteria bacterium]|nr:VanZ family protein [Betaproteobacteria bacterium]